jgi:CheY-like chemotaxis protein
MKERSVLIVEDEGLIALHLQELLQHSGYHVPDPLPTGEDAIEYVKTSPPPDVILMDVTLDGRLDGIETARRIRECADIPIIFLTAHAETSRLARTREVANSVILGKPVVPSAVISAVKEAIPANGILSHKAPAGDRNDQTSLQHRDG